jgi:hypothetical protein
MKSPERSVAKASAFVDKLLSDAEWFADLKDLDIAWQDVIDIVSDEVVDAMQSRDFNYACCLIEELEVQMLDKVEEIEFEQFLHKTQKTRKK